MEQTDQTVWKLYSERDNEHNDWSFCLMVIDAYETLEQGLDRIKDYLMTNERNTCRRHVTFKMSKLYDAIFRKALEFLQHQITIKHDWIYTKEFDRITRYFTRLGYNSASTEANKELLTKIWKLHLDNELNYLEYLEGSSDGHCVAEHLITNIKCRISSTPPVCYIGLISNHPIQDEARMNNSLHRSDAGKKRENEPHRATNTEMEKRKYHDLLLAKLETLKNEQTAQTSGGSGIHRSRNRIGYLQALFELYEKYNKLVDNPHTQLSVELNRLITQVINEVRIKLEKGAYDSDQTLKERVFSLLGDPKAGKWLNRKYEGPVQSQNTVIPAIPEGTITYEQFHDLLDDIFTLMHAESHDEDIMVIRQLKQLIDKHGDETESFPKFQIAIIQKRLKSVCTALFTRLYAPILNAYNKKFRCNLNDIMQNSVIMCRHKDEIIELTPYVPYVFDPNNAGGRAAWQTAACCAWFDDLRSLYYQTSFTETDVDNLLALKDAAPDLPSYTVGDVLVQVLTRLFPFMLQTSPDTALIEKVTKLSEWIDHIGKKVRHNHGITQKLYEYNEEWRERYISKAGERSTTSSSASAARMPSSVHPGTLSVSSSETFDCHSRMRPQDVPHTGQFSIHSLAVPVPAPCGAFQQSAPSIPCHVPITQSATEDRPFPQPWLIGWHFSPYIPAPVYDRVDFHQPLVCGQIQPWWQATSQQPYEPGSAMPFEYRSRYPIQQ